MQFSSGGVRVASPKENRFDSDQIHLWCLKSKWSRHLPVKQAISRVQVLLDTPYGNCDRWAITCLENRRAVRAVEVRFLQFPLLEGAAVWTATGLEDQRIV